MANPVISTELENETELSLRLIDSKNSALILDFAIDLNKFLRLGNSKLPEMKSLPINSLFFATEGGGALYTTEKLYIRLRSQGLISIGIGSLNNDKEVGEGHSEDGIEYSENKEGQDTINALKEQIHAVEENVRLMHEAYDENFLPASALGADSVSGEDTAVFQQYAAVAEQAAKEIEYEELCAAVARAEHQEELEAIALGQEEKAFRDAQRQLQPLVAVVGEETAEIEQTLAAALDTLRDELAGSKFMLEARQLKLMSELQSIYPIEQLDVNSDYAIRGVELPRDLSQKDDEAVAAGLGYVVHLLILLSKYLEVPLRYQLIYQASRSMIRDPISSGGLPSSTSISGGGLVLPLYRRNVDRDRFERALIWLQRDVEQLLACRGLGFDTKKDMLGNLQQLFVCDMCPRLAT